MGISYEYIAYIDEAGDTGLSKVLPVHNNGSSEWFVVGAHLIRRKFESSVVDWVRDVRKDINALQGPALHYRNLSPTKRLRACELVAMKHARAFVVCSNKKNMEGWKNERAASRGGKQWFYNYCVRLVLERLTEFCFNDAMKLYGEPKKIKVIFSERNGHQLAETIAYLELLKIQNVAGTTILSKREIYEQMISFSLMNYAPHTNYAGLQIADVIASAFFQSVNTLSPSWSLEPAKRLSRIMAKDRNIVADFGLVLQPTYGAQNQLDYRQKEIFRHYGYYLP